MRRLMLILGLALALSACQPLNVELDPFPLFPEHRRSTALAAPLPATAAAALSERA